MDKKTNTVWKNTIELFTARPARYYLPASIAEVVWSVREAESKGMRIRAVGAGHSFSDVAITDGTLLDMKHMDAVQAVAPERLKPEARGLLLAEAEAGITVHDLNRRLDDLGWALPTHGAIDNQTISGAIATGTHGCALDWPGLHGIVRSMVLVAHQGQVWRVEPTNGITQPGSHDPSGAKLVQNDDTFYSLLVHLGAFGIITSLIIEVKPQYYLYERRSVEGWRTLKKSIHDGSLFQPYPVEIDGQTKPLKVAGIQITVNPFAPSGDHQALVGRVLHLPSKPSMGLLTATRSIVTNIVARTMIPYEALIHKAIKKPESLPKALDQGLHFMQDEAYVAKSFKVWFQGMEFLALKGFGAEFAYEGETSHWIETLELSFKHVQDIAAKGIHGASPIMIRFTAPGKAYLVWTMAARPPGSAILASASCPMALPTWTRCRISTWRRAASPTGAR
ncbi:MAG: FAD-binding protein [Bacteroidia bacterium]